MNISGLFIRRPILTTLSMLSILLFGIIAYRLLPVSDLPNVDFPTIQVSAFLPGASPETMASAVALPLEKEFSTIAGVDSMNSSSYLGATSVTIQFNLSRNIDAAALDVQAAISRAARKLPPDMPTPPFYRKVNPADYPILYLALNSATRPMSQLDAFGQTQIAQRVSMIDGVAQVQVYGSQKYAVRIELDPRELSSRGIGIDEVGDVIGKYNVNLPLGVVDGPHQAFTVQANGQLTDADKYLPLIVAYRNGQPVRLKDIGTAIDSVENDKMAAWFVTPDLKERAIILAIQRQPGTNTLEVADAIKALLPSFRDKLPADSTLEILRDSSIPIKNSADDVRFTMLLTLGLVVMVIFLFLRNLSATAIPSMVLPMSIIGTFAAMYLLDYSLDNLSLMALTLSMGFVVDDAIVMLENIVRHMEMGKSRMQAALDGSKEIAFTIVSMTLSLAAVFIPFLLMSGLMGRLFREFSVTIGAAVLVSGFVSLTLTPMLCSRFLRSGHGVRHGVFYRAVEGAFTLIQRAYGWGLWGVLRHRLTTLVLSLGVLGLTAWLFWNIPKGFIPNEDRGVIQIQTEASQDISFDAMAAHQLAVAEIIRQNPNVAKLFCSVGGTTTSGGSMNIGRMMVTLQPRDQRTRSVDELIADLRPKLSAVPGIKVFLTNPPPISIGGRMSRSLYQLTLQGTETAELYKYAGYLEDQIRERSDFQDVSSDMLLKCPQLFLEMDRDEAFVRDVTPQQIEDALYYAYGSRQISTIYAADDQYQVILELQKQFQADPSVLSLLYIRSSKGQLVPLNALTTQTDDIGPLVVNHSGQLPSVTISFNLRPGVALSQAVDQIDAVTRASMPGGISYSFQGSAQAFQASMSSMGYLLLLTVIVIYIVLGILYESFYHPLTILSALPFAGVGALLTLMLFHMDLSIYAFVGIIMLVGLVKKNGIMMVDFAIEAQRQGKTPADAIHEACMIRFRPILMTTMAALMGGIPIAAGIGAGAEARQPLGLAVVGGLLFSQTLTLFVTPVFYVYMEKLRTWINRLLAPKIEPVVVLAETEA